MPATLWLPGTCCHPAPRKATEWGGGRWPAGPRALALLGWPEPDAEFSPAQQEGAGLPPQTPEPALAPSLLQPGG